MPVRTPKAIVLFLPTGCVLNVFQGLEFEAPEDDDGVAVKYPLQFSSDDDAEEDE